MAPIPDVFRSPFQTAPLDLTTDAFYPSRRALIEDRLQVTYHETSGSDDADWADAVLLAAALDWGSQLMPLPLQEIAEGCSETILKSRWSRSHGQWCRGISWERFPLEDLLDICRWGPCFARLYSSLFIMQHLYSSCNKPPIASNIVSHQGTQIMG